MQNCTTIETTTANCKTHIKRRQTCCTRMVIRRLVPANRYVVPKVKNMVGKMVIFGLKEESSSLSFVLRWYWKFQNLVQSAMTFLHDESGLTSCKFSSLMGFFHPRLMVPSNHANVIRLGYEAFSSGEGFTTWSVWLENTSNSSSSNVDDDDEVHSSIYTLFEKSNFCPKNLTKLYNLLGKSKLSTTKKCNTANPQHFHDFFTQIFLTIFFVKSKLSTAKKSKTTTFSRDFSPKKNRQLSLESKV